MTKSQTEWWAPVERSDEVSDLFGGDTRVAPVEHKTSRSRGRAKQQRERKRRRRRSIWVLIVAILMVAGAAYGKYLTIRKQAENMGKTCF